MTCPICGLHSMNGIALSDGNIVHDSCYGNAISQLTSLSSKINEVSRSIGALRSKLRASQGVVGNIVRVIFGRGDDPDSIEYELNRLNVSLEEMRNQYSKTNDFITTRIYDFMASYPPDWRDRVQKLREMSHSCTQCGTYKNLHAHHKIPLSRGGSNRLSNLLLLCEPCHKRAHNVDSFSGQTSPVAIDDRIISITNAISSKREIDFLYKKPSDAQYSKRVVTPHRLEKFAHENTDEFTLCVEGFCHKRQENRIFALKRMKNLQVR